MHALKSSLNQVEVNQLTLKIGAKIALKSSLNQVEVDQLMLKMGEGAISIFSSLELDEVIDVTNGCIYIKQMIHHYRDLSETNLVAIRDLQQP